jgi:hypothetical protein
MNKIGVFEEGHVFFNDVVTKKRFIKSSGRHPRHDFARLYNLMYQNRENKDVDQLIYVRLDSSFNQYEKKLSSALKIDILKN